MRGDISGVGYFQVRRGTLSPLGLMVESSVDITKARGDRVPLLT